MSLQKWNKKKKVLLFFSLLILGVSLTLISYGNPQWHKYVYMWQAYVWPNYAEKEWKKDELGLGHIFGPIPMPDQFVGAWRAWDPKGNLIVEKFSNDENKGYMKKYDDKGSLMLIVVANKGLSKPIVVYSRTKNIDRREEYKHLLFAE